MAGLFCERPMPDVQNLQHRSTQPLLLHRGKSCSAFPRSNNPRAELQVGLAGAWMSVRPAPIPSPCRFQPAELTASVMLGALVALIFLILERGVWL